MTTVAAPSRVTLAGLLVAIQRGDSSLFITLTPDGDVIGETTDTINRPVDLTGEELRQCREFAVMTFADFCNGEPML